MGDHNHIDMVNDQQMGKEWFMNSSLSNNQLSKKANEVFEVNSFFPKYRQQLCHIFVQAPVVHRAKQTDHNLEEPLTHPTPIRIHTFSLVFSGST